MIYFIVEGQTDKAFIKNILSPKEEKTDFEFLGLKGISSVITTLEKLTKHDLSQHIYFTLVDADNSFSDVNQKLIELTKDKEIGFYIFPNHEDNGDLETLLLSKIDSENKILKCFDNYQKCVEKEIVNKAKLYAYTTLEFNQKPEKYIETLDLQSDFDVLKEKLQDLF
jgi:hypothetical protein